MLDYMRQHSRSVLIYTFLGIIIAVFIIQFGPQSSGCAPSRTVLAARVGDVTLDSTDVDMHFFRNFGFNLSRDLDLETILRAKRDLLEDTANVYLLAREAERRGFTVGDEELWKYILDPKRNMDYRYFAGEGKEFDFDLYQRVIRSGFRSDVAEYEAYKRKELLARKLLEYLRSQIRVSPSEVAEAYRVKNTSVNLELAIFHPDAFAADVAVSDGEAEAWARAHEADVKAYYEANRKEFDHPKEARLRQIFIEAAEVDEAARKAGRAEAEDLHRRILAGEDFAALAREHSDHPNYKETGGDMGWQSPGNNDPAFDEAAFKLGPGEVSGIVETRLGFYLLKAEEVRPEVKQDLAQATPAIARKLLTLERGREVARKEAESFLARATAAPGETLAALVAAGPAPAPAGGAGEVTPAGQPAGSATAAGGRRIRVEETGPFTQEGGTGEPDLANPFAFRRAWDTIPKVGRSAEMSRAAFALTRERPLAPRVFQVGGAFYVARLKERKDPDPSGLAAAEPTLRETLAREKEARLLGPWERMLFGPAFQRRLFGQAEPLGIWVQAILDKARREEGVEIEEALFRVPEKERGRNDVEEEPSGGTGGGEAAPGGGRK